MRNDCKHVTDVSLHSQIDYNGRIWSGEVCLDEESDEYTQLTLKPEYSVDKGGEKDKNEEETSCLKLMIHVQEMGSWQLTLYCPYWIVNKTGLMLEYAVREGKTAVCVYWQMPMQVKAFCFMLTFSCCIVCTIREGI